MISMEERKLALFIQTHLLRKELENLKRYDYKESQLHTCSGQKAYIGFMELVASLDLKSKEK